MRTGLTRALVAVATSFVAGLAMGWLEAPSWPAMLVAFAGGVAVARLAQVCGVGPPCPIHGVLERRGGAGLAAPSPASVRGVEVPWRSYRCPVHGAFERGIELDAKGDPPAEVACLELARDVRGSAGYTTCGEPSSLIIAAPAAAYAGSVPGSSSPGVRGAGSVIGRIGCSDPECWSCDGHWTTEEDAAVARRSLPSPGVPEVAFERACLEGVSAVEDGAFQGQVSPDLATVEQVSWSAASPTLAVYSERALTPHEKLTPREQAERVVLGAMIARPWLLDRSFIGIPSAEDMVNATHRDVARAIHRIWLGGGPLPADPLGMAHAVCVHLTGRPAGVYLFFLWGLVEESIQVIGTPATDEQARGQFDGAVEWLREIARDT